MKFLIVEDDLIARRILKALLSPYGDCDVAVNGQEAIDSFLLAFESKNLYDLILMDVMMPVLDGLEALRGIRAIENSKGIPTINEVKVIMTTALDDPHTVISAFKTGDADAYLVKPIGKVKLLEKLRELKIIE